MVGPPDIALSWLNQIDEATAGQLTFVGEAGYASRWADSKASAALVSEGIELEPGEGRALIYVSNADLAMAKVLEAFAPDPVQPAPGIAPSALIAEDVVIAEGVRIGPNCVVRSGVVLGEGVTLHANVVLMDGVKIGAGSVLWPGVVVRERCEIGRHCVLEPNVVIGADGFGYRADTSGSAPRIVKVPHLGRVILGDEVELGAGTCVDRGKFGPTRVGDGSKIDNLVQIGHNCQIGRMVMMSGCCAVAGSVTIGDGALIGGASIFKDHLTIGKGCRIAGGSAVMHDVPDGQEWAGYPAKPARDAFREEMAVRKLPEVMRQVKKMMPQ